MKDKICILTNSPNVVSDAFEILEFVGYDVFEIEQLTGLTKYKDTQLILIYNSSLKDAYEWVRELKTKTDLKDLPILLLIRRKEYGTLLELYQMGIADYIELPVMDIELISKVALYIELKKSRERVENLYRELKESMNLAVQLQKLMLPASISLQSNMWITSHYIPSEIVGGDMYDYFIVNGDIFIYVADISGHGLQSALLCSSVKSLFRSATRRSDSIVKAVNELAESVKSVLGYNYITGLFLRIKPDGSVQYLNCGHPSIIIYDDAGFKEMDMKNALPVGIFDYAYTEDDIGTFSIERGKTYLLYSDGVYSGFEKIAGNGRNSREMLFNFLNEEIAGIIPEILPFYIASRLRIIFSNLPDDYSLVCFGKAGDYCYFGDHGEIVNVNASNGSMVEMFSRIKGYAISDEPIILLNDHEKYKTLLTKKLEIGHIIRELPMSVSMTFDDVSAMKLFM